MLKLTVRTGNFKQNKQEQALSANQSAKLRESKLTTCFRFIKKSLSRDRAKGFLPLKPQQSIQNSSFYKRHKKSITQPSQNTDSRSLHFLQTLYNSQQKLTIEDKNKTKKRTLLNKILFAFDSSQWERTKKEEQFLVSKHTLKKHSLYQNICSQRQSQLQRRSFYFSQKQKHMLTKLSSQRQTERNSQINDILVVKRCRGKQSKSLNCYK